MDRPRPIPRVRRRLVLAHRLTPLAVAAFALALPVPAFAQVYKCVDGGGRVTYQQTPCAAGQKGGALNVTADNGQTRGPETSAEWNAAVAEKRVVNGMTRNWVVQALGTPAEKRPPRPGETASEVWIYPSQTDVLRVGFFGDAVAWQSRDPMKSGTPDTQPLRNVQARDAVSPGQNCDQVRAELGPADTEESVVDLDPSGKPRGTLGTRYTWEQAGAAARLVFTCVQNRVIDIERTISTLPAAATPSAPR